MDLWISKEPENLSIHSSTDLFSEASTDDVFNRSSHRMLHIVDNKSIGKTIYLSGLDIIVSKRDLSDLKS